MYFILGAVLAMCFGWAGVVGFCVVWIIAESWAEAREIKRAMRALDSQRHAR
jgi:hypothetical protein